jgi:uncharacterized membrane protein
MADGRSIHRGRWWRGEELDRRTGMKTTAIAGVLLIVLGIVSLAYQGITYTTQKKVVDVGPIHATKDENHNIRLPPILGGLLLIGGIVLLASGSIKAT